MINREANAYQNVHYMYIERILDSGILEVLANENGMKLMRKASSGLEDEFAMQEGLEQGQSLLDIVSSFE